MLIKLSVSRPTHSCLIGKLFCKFLYLSRHLYGELSSGFAGSGMAFISLQLRQFFRDCAGK